ALIPRIVEPKHDLDLAERGSTQLGKVPWRLHHPRTADLTSYSQRPMRSWIEAIRSTRVVRTERIVVDSLRRRPRRRRARPGAPAGRQAGRSKSSASWAAADPSHSASRRPLGPLGPAGIETVRPLARDVAGHDKVVMVAETRRDGGRERSSRGSKHRRVTVV